MASHATETKIISTIIKKKMNTDEGAATALEEECAICCEPYNNSDHKRVICEYGSCQYTSCVECTKAYLLTSTNKAHCMECKQPWTSKFILVLTKKWLSETYRNHRSNLLCEVEMSKIPETMEYAENYQKSKKEKEIRDTISKEIQKLQGKLNALNELIDESLRRERVLRDGGNARAVGAAAVEEKKVFFMSCPATACNGMLSTQYKCGICESFTCPECHEVIGKDRKMGHTCDPNNVASALAIKTETKQCPGCHNRIYKIEGCSQMWCTGCHTAFDWTTGKKVISEQLHNPHWVEYQRSLNQGTAPRAPGDVPCGGLCTDYDLRQRIIRKITSGNQLYSDIRSIHRFIHEITNRIREIRMEIQLIRDFRHMRMRYIVGEVTKDDFKTHIFKKDRDLEKNTEILHVWELLCAVGIDMFNLLLHCEEKGEAFIAVLVTQIFEYNALRIHCNGLFSVISNTYGLTVPQACDNWAFTSGKFNSKTMMTDKKTLAVEAAVSKEAISKQTN